ncbi:uncharacterized protein CANTADRAFT_43620 [Suhomyces tanzawaensis NRRL Y-17324]|uniref:SGF29 C-terminal domain-containing protein n=1 Tax=Suhomyces tanzawaensis NRRL Y-17324 TaxID=984487 RepID=A0A1E4SRC7_9ASCO|nr:uncharacterized protein CANTADRAFT_43620 [Suhomyces tanzawaensis NRRL Y-17324]ODV82054.1 hypothetical protein CANTADRAFT_43620 [Suhomyces tanzawaensis NRRL Y-17324]
MQAQEIEGNWDIVITSLQDICNANDSLTFDNVHAKYLKEVSVQEMLEDDLNKLKEEVSDHKSNIGTAKRLIDTSQQNLQTLIEYLQKKADKDTPASSPIRNNITKKSYGTAGGKGSPAGKSSPAAKVVKKSNTKKVGRLYYTSKYNPLEPIFIGSEVAYKLRNRHFEEWIQCEVMKVIGDGIKFEIRDPEPDENNNPGQTFKANYKELLLIPPLSEVKDLAAYPYGTKVLARYPETTTFYPAIVVGNRKDGNVRLKFDGEEEVNKETEVERRLVLPFPEK